MTIKKPELNYCPSPDCKICSSTETTKKFMWVLSGTTALIIFAIGFLFESNADATRNVSKNSTDVSVLSTKMDYTIESINDIKKAMGLEIRLPPNEE